MALESASYIADLNTSNPLSTDTVSQADDHLRLIKKVLKDTFPNLNGPVTSTPLQLNSPVPSGFIGMWSGVTAPTGWYLCDGTNGTPDLRNRFIVGAGTSYAIGATGGADTVTLSESQIPSHTHSISATSSGAGAHNHSITISDPGHKHIYYSGNGIGAPGYPTVEGDLNNNILATPETAPATTGITASASAVGDHTHTITASATTTGGSLAHENRPPYYALAYIMKA